MSLVVGLTVLPFAGRALAESAAVLVEKEKVVEARSQNAGWRAAALGSEFAARDGLRTGEFSRAALRFTDRSMLRVDELTTIEISASPAAAEKTLEMKRGGAYFYSRERPEQIRIRTAVVNGALRGTEFALRVAADGKTTVAMFEGEVELSNPQGRLLVRSGEMAEVVAGGAPRKTAMIEATNIIQWCLYYPAVLDPAELGFGADSENVAAYRAGNLPGALAVLPTAGGGKAARVYRAAVILSSGQVQKAEAILRGVPASDGGRRALERMIAAVQMRASAVHGEPITASEWLAESYARQARHDLEAARAAARRATELSPGFGFAWARLAELEFSFGRTESAMQMVERALELAPQNAQAHALQGFLLSAENRLGAAQRCFEQAIALDGALGNAWLGRGLISIRQGEEEAGRHDLQTAAVLEPSRSVLRSYLGKAFSQVGIDDKANLELKRAQELDPADPTPWLYSAIQRKQENRYNEAIEALEKSVELNDNRRVYRSQFLLDQDRAIRGANLASIYLNNGLTEQSVREAVRAVGSDYGSAGAHLFLANSYNALRDPNRVLLRYETAWFNELLLSNLLSPVGAGPLSQFVSEQEYSKLFEKDGLGISSLTEYRSDGQVRAIASQFGTSGNLSYALDAEYFFDNGNRPNNEVSRFESYGTFKLQLSPQDTVFLQVKYQDFSSGDVFQRYDPRDVERTVTIDGVTKKVEKNVAGLTFDFREKQEPGLLLGGWHHEWAPGQHTLLLLGRFAADDALRYDDARVPFVLRDASLLAAEGTDTGVSDGTIPRDRQFFSAMRRLLGRAPLFEADEKRFDLESRQRFEIRSAELQHIATFGAHTVIVGGRFQSGRFEAESRLADFENGLDAFGAVAFEKPELRQRTAVDLERVSLYLYELWRPWSWLGVTAGVTYDSLDFPANTTSPPINGRQSSVDEVSPKFGLILQPWRGATLRAAYSESIGGASFEESVRLEPTQVAGFLQGTRSVLSESLLGSVAGSKYRFSGLSFEQKLPSRTYLGVEYRQLRQDLDRTLGAIASLDFAGTPLANLPSAIEEKDSYREDTFTFTANQLVGTHWAFGARYDYTRASLRQQLAGFGDALAAGLLDPGTVEFRRAELARLADGADQRTVTGLHHLQLDMLYNHPSGFFARADAQWYRQDENSYVTRPDFSAVDVGTGATRRRVDREGRPSDDFWQFNVVAGYRFLRNQCEVSCGVLNLSGQDYQLDPLTPYAELPRERTFFVRCRLNF